MRPATLFRDRLDAGQALARELQGHYGGRKDLLVLGLARGGVPVGYEVARALGAPLDAFVVRKLGVPGHPELAMGAIATGGAQIVNDEVVSHLAIPEEAFEAVAAEERLELARRTRAFRGDRPDPVVRGKTVILVDDGLATGSTMRAAVAALRRQGPLRIVVAVPVGSSSTCAEIAGEVDDVVCAETPEPFYAVGQAYQDFAQTTDEEVKSLLERSGAAEGSAP